MRPLFICLLLCPLLLLANCVPITQKPAPDAAKGVVPFPTPPGAGPYWHATAEQVNPADALSYYAALKTLNSQELNHEYQRLLLAAAAPDNRFAHLQLLLMAMLPGQTLLAVDEATRHLEASRQDATFHRELANLLILLDDQLTSRQTTQQSPNPGKQESPPVRISQKKFKKQSEELASCQQESENCQQELEGCQQESESCRQERTDLADKLQKLQEIERGMMDRERKK